MTTNLVGGIDLGKKLIITEKPSVAQDYAKVFQVSGRNNGYIENDKYVITWCVGHLVEMVYPEEYDMKYKKWMLEALPFLPQNYKYGVIPNVKQQYDIVHGLLHREDIDTVYCAGDSGKEGQTIEENIRNFGGVRDPAAGSVVYVPDRHARSDRYFDYHCVHSVFDDTVPSAAAGGCKSC